MAKYEPVIGLEVHVELNTKTKMFCRCSAEYFGKAPNSQVCPVCLGLPGALPYANEEAIKKCIQIGLALNCQINPRSLFERKNYFYPDLAKGFQISQLRWPLCINGYLEVEDSQGEVTKIRINRVHQEEDTGKLMHVGGSALEVESVLRTTGYELRATLIDFNRCGVPLVEIVTEPDFKDPVQVRNYAKALQQIFRDLGVSNADMERGDMRLEANISVRRVESRESRVEKKLPNYRVELKNINSFRFMVAAVDYEIKRQVEALERGEKLHQETRGWNEDKNETFLQRSKENANDYRYFPEPDLPELKTEESRVESLVSSMPKLTMHRLGDIALKYGLSKAIMNSLASEPRRVELFEQLVARDENLDPIKAANTVANLSVNVVDRVSVEDVLTQIQQKTVGLVSDQDELEKLAQEVIAENPAGAVDSYRAGKEAAIGVLIGTLMRKAGGKADAGKAKEILEKLLKS